MNKSKIQTGQNDGENKTLKGLQNRGEVNFDCADCGKRLLVLQLVSTEEDNQSEILSRIVAKCGLCGGHSYVKQISGQFYPGAPSDNMVIDISNDSTGVPEADVIFEARSK
jgi:transcription elongation factor Elf1